MRPFAPGFATSLRAGSPAAGNALRSRRRVFLSWFVTLPPFVRAPTPDGAPGLRLIGGGAAFRRPAPAAKQLRPWGLRRAPSVGSGLRRFAARPASTRRRPAIAPAPRPERSRRLGTPRASARPPGNPRPLAAGWPTASPPGRQPPTGGVRPIRSGLRPRAPGGGSCLHAIHATGSPRVVPLRPGRARVVPPAASAPPYPPSGGGWPPRPPRWGADSRRHPRFLRLAAVRCVGRLSPTEKPVVPPFQHSDPKTTCTPFVRVVP